MHPSEEIFEQTLLINCSSLKYFYKQQVPFKFYPTPQQKNAPI